MKTLQRFGVALFFSILFSIDVFGQTPPFDINAYRTFLQQSRNMSASQLQALHPAGTFVRDVNASLNGIAFFDSVDTYYHLTAYEKQLLRKHSFVVTERLKRESFGKAFYDVYKKDLPVFVSTDAVLHAIHMSYDKILMDVEWDFLIPKVDTLLARLHARLPALDARYAGTPAMRTSLKDLDVYLTVPRILLSGTSVSPYYAENVSTISTLLQHISAEQGDVPFQLFSSTERRLDFSQFKPRGHYVGPTVDSMYAKYFRAMIWLGRMELYLIAPQSGPPNQTEADIQRQAIDAVLIREAAQLANAFSLLEEIDGIIRFFVGESDNVTLPNIQTLVQATTIDSASQLLNLQRFRTFQDSLQTKSFAFQRIVSQILCGNPGEVDSITPASSFLLLGQRFIVDSYVTSNVVYDRIVYLNTRIRRMLPSTLDILFSLGNNATNQLLQQQLDQYHYASNLASLRYLIDSYGDDFWHVSLYNAWLDAIRKLNPPRMRDSLPTFMRTGAWWQEKINTQQASWAQLRHDNLLYAKQSYTGVPICSFPESYVEPIPAFFDAIKTFAEIGRQRFLQPPFTNQWVADYFTHVKGTMDTLGEISRKELANISLTAGERDYMKRMLHTIPLGCSPDSTFDGWYARLYYQPMWRALSGIKDVDIVVADVHTAPADEGGATVGWVLHGGTGALNMGVWIADKPGGGAHAYVGPVMSYCEHVTTNFHRFTDEEWLTAHNMPPSFRPSYVNLYLADSMGNSRGTGINLTTSVGNGSVITGNYPESPVLYQNYPNPFNPATFIAFTVPPSYANSHVELAIYDVQGERVQTLVNSTVPAGNFASRWDGTNEKRIGVASGVYFYRLRVGGFVDTKKLIVVR